MLAADDPALTPEARTERADQYVRKALELLATALDLGYSDSDYLETSEAFAPVRDPPEFQALVDRLPRKS